MISEEYCVGLFVGENYGIYDNSKIYDAGFRFVAVDLSYPSSTEHLKPLFMKHSLRDKIAVEGDFSSWSRFLVGRLDPNAIKNAEHKDEDIWRPAVSKLLFELEVVKFMLLPAVLVELPTNCPPGSERLAMLLADYFSSCDEMSPNQRNTVFWFSIQLSAEDEDHEHPWLVWNDLRRRFTPQRKIALVLEFPPDGSVPPENVMDRWMGEPLRGAILPASLFSGERHCTLSPEQEELLKQLFVAGCQAFVKPDGDEPIETTQLYASAVKEIFAMQINQTDWLGKAARGFVDYLQAPLQPLADHLEASTYAVFEEDPCKYKEYENAVRVAITERKASGKEPPFVLMVVGAGRGPLVDSAMRASASSGIPLKLFAVEKNPNAVRVLLKRKRDEEKWRSVTVISCDMREWKTDVEADILVSELLGSFGDNELSPECLDGAQRFLKDDGISIPQSYTSYVSPIQSCKLYSEAQISQTRLMPEGAALDTMYVVHMKLKWIIAPPKPVFTFRHPNWELTSNDRYEELSFTAPKKGVLHGFAGYFDTVLYKDVILSIHPDTHSDQLISWFPVFIPAKEPVEFEAGDTITLQMWRKSDDRKAWYEYRVTSPRMVEVQNRDGINAEIRK